MLYLLPCVLAAEPQEQFTAGGLAGYGRSWTPDNADDKRTAVTAGVAFAFYLPPVFYMPASLQLLVLKVPGGSVFFPDVSAGYGIAPFGRWGPHAAGLVGVGARLTGIEANLGWSAGVGLGPVSIDYRRRGGWQSYAPDRFVAHTLELSVQLVQDEP